MHRSKYMIMLSCLALSSCSAHDRNEPVTITTPQQLKANTGARCSVVGVAVDPHKGFLVVQSSSGSAWLVALRGSGSWPRDALVKMVRVSGVASELTPRVNDKGEPIDSHGRVVAGYNEPVLYLNDCMYEMLDN
jgi:hypothetical protein